jgi:hypothetical protein
MKSKTLFLITSILILTSITLKAQTLLGVKGGVNWASMIYFQDPGGSENDNYTPYPSCSFELEVKGRKPTYFHLGTYVMYYRSYFKWHYSSGGYLPETKDIDYRLDYLRVAFFPEFSTKKRVRFFCNIGPYLEIMLHSSRNGNYSYYPNPSFAEPQYMDISGSAFDYFNQYDVGIQETMGVSYMLNPWLGITFEENASLGFTNTDKQNNILFLHNAGIRLQLGVAFVIPPKKKEPDATEINH